MLRAALRFCLRLLQGRLQLRSRLPCCGLALCCTRQLSIKATARLRPQRKAPPLQCLHIQAGDRLPAAPHHALVATRPGSVAGRGG